MSRDDEARRDSGMSDRRRERVRLEISREASRLFWQQGLAATSGEQIAEAVELSVRTLWRYFPTKESCAEPIVAQGTEWLMAMMRTWPRERSLEEHFATERAKRPQTWDARQKADNQLTLQMIDLGRREPAIRAAWLMANDRLEQEMAVIIAERLRRVTHDSEVRLHAAAATAVVRVINEDVISALLPATADEVDVDDLARRTARAVHRATGGAVGEPVDS
jgi:AcrR family transcriptional regulator